MTRCINREYFYKTKEFPKLITELLSTFHKRIGMKPLLEQTEENRISVKVALKVDFELNGNNMRFHENSTDS